MIQLKANGKIFEGWLTAHVTRSLAAISGSFEISYTDRWSGQGEKWQLKAGDECELSYKGQPIIKGYIDAISTSYTGTSRSLSVRGRDKTGDLVDSSNLSDAKEFKGKSLKDMASTLASPFGVSVAARCSGASAPIEKVSIQQNETVWETIDRLAKYQGVLAYPDAKGGLILNEVSSEVSESLVEGENILSCSVEQNETEKFNTYMVIASTSDPDEKHKTAIAKVTDSSVKRPRLKTLLTHKAITKDEALERAKWEMAQKISKSLNINISCSDWIHSRKKIWEINSIVSVKAPACGVNGLFLIEETKFVCDENGLKTELKLVLKEAYKPKPDRSKETLGEFGGV
ncbi:phage baseplate assembly protein [Silvanigrella aquatica]|uniref:Uncharacterized protein n=1 Tax=Silvanigrella aquatica TaxID=1915309 RepID=A0A1L4D169_9BACT|nr:contractile injection system protein, VgrG/Pvc8 family [Silvanigrella aquatica]APJ03941.1 hypothetical protein AXG55_08495 [Silvanigrella aquatica]